MPVNLRPVVPGLVAVLYVMLLGSCVTTTSGGGTTMLGGGGGGADPVVMKINGRAVKMDELIKAPAFHQAFQQYAFVSLVKERAAKEGITPDAAAIDKKIADQKDQMAKMGMKWDDMLKQQSMTEPDVREMMEVQDLHAQLMKKLSGNISDDEIKAAWNKRQKEFVDSYAAQHYLTEAQKKGLKFEDLKDYIKDQLAQENQSKTGQKALMDMMRQIKVDFPALGDRATQDKYVELIFKGNLPPDNEAKPAAGSNQPPAQGGNAPPPAAAKPAPGQSQPPASADGKAPPAPAPTPAEPKGGTSGQPATPPSAKPAPGGGGK